MALTTQLPSLAPHLQAEMFLLRRIEATFSSLTMVEWQVTDTGSHCLSLSTHTQDNIDGKILNIEHTAVLLYSSDIYFRLTVSILEKMFRLSVCDTVVPTFFIFYFLCFVLGTFGTREYKTCIYYHLAQRVPRHSDMIICAQFKCTECTNFYSIMY